MPNLSDCRCVLVIGATAGLGRALALAIRDLPSSPHVVITGRRPERLEELDKEERVDAVKLDISASRDTLIESVNDILKKFPDIDGVIFSAGIQRQIDFTQPDTVDLDVALGELSTNFVSVITMISKCFIPHFQTLDRPALIVPITSGLALKPKPDVPIYCATKAALHSFSISLTKQLADAKSKISVAEIMPPLVESELHDQQGTTEHLSKFWMPLNEWTKNTMNNLLKLNGSGIVICGTFQPIYEKYEKEKLKDIIPQL